MDSLIKKLKTKTGLVVYHVEDCGIIQEFRTLLEAKEFVRYIQNHFPRLSLPVLLKLWEFPS
jgi:hypothetical protein